MAGRPARPVNGWPIGAVAAKVGVTHTGDATQPLETWLDALAEWNAKIDLTAAKDADALVWLMLADAWILSQSVPRSASIVDVGTGAGAPGLALAILRPDLRVTIVEPLAKRAAFLRTTIGTLGRMDIKLVAQGAHELAPAQYDVAMSRATLPPSEWLELGSSLVRDGGSVWVFLARGEAPSSGGATLMETLEYDDPTSTKRLLRYVVRA